jgi:hypothetical protein
MEIKDDRPGAVTILLDRNRAAVRHGDRNRRHSPALISAAGVSSDQENGAMPGISPRGIRPAGD